MTDVSGAGYLAAAALPIVGAIHRYATNYGFRGQSRRHALEDALHAGWALALVVAGVLLCASTAGKW